MDKKLYRVLDANFNRAKEGLRVCEDICRFLHNSKSTTQKYKTIRHQLTALMSKLNVHEAIKARSVATDVGRKGTFEGGRRDVKDIYYANSQRIKESIRVLEEFAKLFDGKVARGLKTLRYKTYGLEKEIVRTLL